MLLVLGVLGRRPVPCDSPGGATGRCSLAPRGLLTTSRTVLPETNAFDAALNPYTERANLQFAFRNPDLLDSPVEFAHNCCVFVFLKNTDVSVDDV